MSASYFIDLLKNFKEEGSSKPNVIDLFILILAF